MPCAPATCSSSPAASRSTATGRLVGGDDVVAQTRQVFANIGAVLAAGGRGFADVVKVTVFLTDIDDRARINTVRQEIFGDARPASTLVEVSALAIPGAQRRGRSGGARPVTDAYNAVITEVEPARGAAGAAARQAAARQGPDRHRRHPHDLRLADLRRPRARRAPRPRSSGSSRAGAVVVGKANLHEFAWGVTSQNPWYGTVQNPRAPGPHDRRLVGRQRGGARRGALRPRARHRHRLLDPPARRVLRRRRAEAELGPHPDRRRLPALPDASTRSGPMATTVADVALDVVGARRRRRCPSRGSPG